VGCGSFAVRAVQDVVPSRRRSFSRCRPAPRFEAVDALAEQSCRYDGRGRLVFRDRIRIACIREAISSDRFGTPAACVSGWVRVSARYVA
jgi:hypothetical protein